MQYGGSGPICIQYNGLTMDLENGIMCMPEYHGLSIAVIEFILQ